MLDIWQTAPDSYTITIKQNMQFQVRIWPEKLKMAIINLYMPDIWKAEPDVA